MSPKIGDALFVNEENVGFFTEPISFIVISSKICVDSVSIMFTINTPKNIQAIAITAPIPSDGQWIVNLDDLSVIFDKDSIELVFLSSFKKKLGILSFESDSMSAIKNHVDLGLYNTFKKSKQLKNYNVRIIDR